ncbi:MAG: hypothetical protein Q4D51_11215 [Eubacteriales bacterium]|nr:hypothetical protein [Eubacteriales bacterium]
MRHVYMRGILGLIWLVAAIACAVMGNYSMIAIFALLGGVYLYSAYSNFKKLNVEK